jgi:virginiamycin B lyase
MAQGQFRTAGSALLLTVVAFETLVMVASPAQALPPPIHQFPVSSSPWGITAGPDGNLWFTEHSGNKIGRITPAGVITEFPIPTRRSGPFGITAGPDGNLWFTETNGNKIGAFDPRI